MLISKQSKHAMNGIRYYIKKPFLSGFYCFWRKRYDIENQWKVVEVLNFWVCWQFLVLHIAGKVEYQLLILPRFTTGSCNHFTTVNCFLLRFNDVQSWYSSTFNWSQINMKKKYNTCTLHMYLIKYFVCIKMKKKITQSL